MSDEEESYASGSEEEESEEESEQESDDEGSGEGGADNDKEAAAVKDIAVLADIFKHVKRKNAKANERVRLEEEVGKCLHTR
jgi:hypothetical protein